MPCRMRHFLFIAQTTLTTAIRHTKKWTYLFDALLVLIYWVTLSVLGALIGSLIPFRTDGIDFALTALFIVILLEQLKSAGGSRTCRDPPRFPL